MRAIAAGMNHPLGNALVIEVEYLLTKMEVVDEKRTTWTNPQRVLVVGNGAALCRRQQRRIALGDLMQFATFAALHFLVVNRRGHGLGCN